VATVGVVLVGGSWLAEHIATSFWFDEPIDVSDTDKTSVSTRTEGDQRALERAVSPSAYRSLPVQPVTLLNGLCCEPVGNPSG